MTWDLGISEGLLHPEAIPSPWEKLSTAETSGVLCLACVFLLLLPQREMLVMKIMPLSSVIQWFSIATFRSKKQAKFYTGLVFSSSSSFLICMERKWEFCTAWSSFNRSLFWISAPGKMEVAYILQSIFIAIKQIQRIFLIHKMSRLCILVYILLSLWMDGYRLLSLFDCRTKKTVTSFDHTDF